jgi:hypothetical protein
MITEPTGSPVPALSSDDVLKLLHAYNGPGRSDVIFAAAAISGARPDGATWFDAAVARLALLIECVGPNRPAAVGAFLKPPLPEDLPHSRSAVHSALLCAVGRIPMNYGEQPPLTLVLDLARTILNQMDHGESDRFRRMLAGMAGREVPRATGQVIPFPAVRRLEQMHEATDDYDSFPEGPSAA